MGANYSYGVWEQFAYQASTILRTFKNHSKSRSVHICFKCSDLDPNSRTYLFYQPELRLENVEIYILHRIICPDELCNKDASFKYLSL